MKTTYKMYHHRIAKTISFPKDVKKSAGISYEYTGFVRGLFRLFIIKASSLNKC